MLTLKAAQTAQNGLRKALSAINHDSGARPANKNITIKPNDESDQVIEVQCRFYNHDSVERIDDAPHPAYLRLRCAGRSKEDEDDSDDFGDSGTSGYVDMSVPQLEILYRVLATFLGKKGT